MVPLVLIGAACGSDNDSGGETGTVSATERDFSIELSSSEVPAGAVTFDISNEGPSVHEFVVFKTDLAPDQLQVTSGAVDEEGEGIEPVDEVEDIAADSTETLDVNLEAGSYVVICNVPGHYEQGMHAALTATD